MLVWRILKFHVIEKKLISKYISPQRAKRTQRKAILVNLCESLCSLWYIFLLLLSYVAYACWISFCKSMTL